MELGFRVQEGSGSGFTRLRAQWLRFRFQGLVFLRSSVRAYR